jgi:hypothetical protein
MQKVVEIADFVKFAKVRPLPDDNVRAWQNALQFVEETKPAPEPEEDGKQAATPARENNEPTKDKEKK